MKPYTFLVGIKVEATPLNNEHGKEFEPLSGYVALNTL